MGNSRSTPEIPVMQVFYPDPDRIPLNEKPLEPKPEEPSSRICHLPSTYELVNLKNIVYMTAKSFAIVSSKPLVPGHVMVFPFNATNLVLDPRHPAAADLYSTAQHVGAALMVRLGVSHFFILTTPAYKLETNYSFKRDCLHILPITEFSDELINRLKNYYEDPMDELVKPELNVMAEAALLREICYYKISRLSRLCLWLCPCFYRQVPDDGQEMHSVLPEDQSKPVGDVANDGQEMHSVFPEDQSKPVGNVASKP